MRYILRAGLEAESRLPARRRLSFTATGRLSSQSCCQATCSACPSESRLWLLRGVQVSIYVRMPCRLPFVGAVRLHSGSLCPGGSPIHHDLEVIPMLS